MINIQEQLTDGTNLFGWKSKPPLTPFAPSYTHYFTEKKIFSEEECESWYKYLLEQETILFDKYKIPSGNAILGGLGSPSLTTRLPYYNLLKFDFHLMPKLKTEIFDSVKTILSISDNTNWHETLYSKGWFNVLRKKEFMDVHFHGFHEHIFYGFQLTIGGKGTFTSYHHPHFFPFDQNIAYQIPNKIGYLTLFPNFIPHSVSVNRHSIPRITIAGDISSVSWFHSGDVGTPTRNWNNTETDWIKLGKL